MKGLKIGRNILQALFFLILKKFEGTTAHDNTDGIKSTVEYPTNHSKFAQYSCSGSLSEQAQSCKTPVVTLESVRLLWPAGIYQSNLILKQPNEADTSHKILSRAVQLMQTMASESLTKQLEPDAAKEYVADSGIVSDTCSQGGVHLSNFLSNASNKRLQATVQEGRNRRENDHFSSTRPPAPAHHGHRVRNCQVLSNQASDDSTAKKW
jgi:hypothetical protein